MCVFEPAVCVSLPVNIIFRVQPFATLFPARVSRRVNIPSSDHLPHEPLHILDYQPPLISSLIRLQPIAPLFPARVSRRVNIPSSDHLPHETLHITDYQPPLISSLIRLQPFAPLFPTRVIAPGSLAANISPQAASQFGLPTSCVVGGGTTDSIAAFVAAGVSQPGQAVTSLGCVQCDSVLCTCKVCACTLACVHIYY